jgi:hypothetical protein
MRDVIVSPDNDSPRSGFVPGLVDNDVPDADAKNVSKVRV